jgi:hypothetical protein
MLPLRWTVVQVTPKQECLYEGSRKRDPEYYVVRPDDLEERPPPRVLVQHNQHSFLLDVREQKLPLRGDRFLEQLFEITHYQRLTAAAPPEEPREPVEGTGADQEAASEKVRRHPRPQAERRRVELLVLN